MSSRRQLRPISKKWLLATLPIAAELPKPPSLQRSPKTIIIRLPKSSLFMTSQASPYSKYLAALAWLAVTILGTITNWYGSANQ